MKLPESPYKIEQKLELWYIKGNSIEINTESKESAFVLLNFMNIAYIAGQNSMIDLFLPKQQNGDTLCETN